MSALLLLVGLTHADDPKVAALESFVADTTETVETTPPPPPSPPQDFTLEERPLRWGGYYENQLALVLLPGQDLEAEDLLVMDYDKLLLELSARPAPGFSAHANLVFRVFHGTKTLRVADFVPERFESDLALLAFAAPELTQVTLANEVLLKDAYATGSYGPLRVRLGKQPLRFGSGYLWNPTDPFTSVDMLDPSYEKEGVTALRAQVYLPREILLEGYVLPDVGLDPLYVDKTGVALRARYAPGLWVLAATYVGFEDLAGLDLDATTTDGAFVMARRHLLGGEVTGEVAGIGLWAEAAVLPVPFRLTPTVGVGITTLVGGATWRLDSYAQPLASRGRLRLVGYWHLGLRYDSAKGLHAAIGVGFIPTGREPGKAFAPWPGFKLGMRF